MFYVCAAFDVLGIIVFGLFASGEMQPWARDSKYDVEIIVDSDPEIVPSTELNKTALNGLQVDKTALNGLNDQHVFGSKQSPVQENGADIANLSDQLNNG